ncbi:MAG: VOC family protein [Dehalococcoidia bacterium]|nr:VOC family protein [Dehalococcoidia bacterium]
MAFVACSDAAVALAFYRDTLGLSLIADEPFALVFDTAGTQLRVQKVQQVVVVPYTALGWRVPDMAASVAALTARGVRFELFPGMPQDASGVMAFPGGAQVAWFKDPDDNLLSLTQFF